jgi:exonuclease-1
MGITGLLPLLRSIQRPIRIDELRGETVGVDAYCWLHKACYGCAQELALGTPTAGFLDFCVNRLELLLHHGVTPIFIFDGCYLPMKADKEKEREA